MRLYATMCGVVLFSSFNTLRQYTQSLCDALDFPSCFHKQIKGFLDVITGLSVCHSAWKGVPWRSIRGTWNKHFFRLYWLYDNSHQLWPSLCHLVDGIPQFIKEKDPSHGSKPCAPSPTCCHPDNLALGWLDTDVGRGRRTRSFLSFIMNGSLYC